MINVKDEDPYLEFKVKLKNLDGMVFAIQETVVSKDQVREYFERLARFIESHKSIIDQAVIEGTRLDAIVIAGDAKIFSQKMDEMKQLLEKEISGESLYEFQTGIPVAIFFICKGFSKAVQVLENISERPSKTTEAV